MTVIWKAQVSSEVAMIWSGGNRKPVHTCISQLHAGGELDTGLSVGPVSRATAGDVQHTGDTASIISFAMHSGESIRAVERQLQHLLVVVGQSVGESPG